MRNFQAVYIPVGVPTFHLESAQEQLDKIYSETGFTLDMGFASNMLKHYLDSTGETYDFSADMPDLLTNAKIGSAQSTNVSAAMKAAENLVQNGQSDI